MSKILILGKSSSGKSTSLGRVVDKERGIDITGLDPKETFIIACNNKNLPFSGWKKNYTPATLSKGTDGQPVLSKEGNYIRTKNGARIAMILAQIKKTRPEIQNVVIDDSNYVMQDYYMDNALTGGYDVFKKIGFSMGQIFGAIDAIDAANKNLIMIAHYEEFRENNFDGISYRFKTVGKMVQDYITPEGKFEIVLFADQFFDEQTKTPTKRFVTNYDGQYPAKSPVGMFKELYVPNDMNYILKHINAYEKGIEV